MAPSPHFRAMPRIVLLALCACFAFAAPAAAQVFTDRDGDGIGDSMDQCPDQPGTGMFAGCPRDQDNDGVDDGVDACWGEKGTAEHQGCPFEAGDVDSDGDGLADRFDNCPTQASRVGRGCPPPDGDGDGFVGEADRCPAVAGPENGCPVVVLPPEPQPVTPVEPPTATSVSADGLPLKRATGPAAARRLKALQMEGGFSASPTGAYMEPTRVTIWLPKTVTVSSAPLAPCRESFARTLTLATSKRCTQMFAGRLNTPRTQALRAWFAWAGPKQGAKQRLWLRARRNDALVGFGKGLIEPASGGRTKVTLELGALEIQTRSVAVVSGPFNTARGFAAPLRGRCQPFRMRLDTAQGSSAEKTFRC